MMNDDDAPARAAAVVAERYPGFQPRVGLVLGSGLGDVADALGAARHIPYGELPGFPVPTVTGHAGRLVLGWLGGVAVACLSGREHFFEGNGCAGMTAAVRCLRLLSCDTLFLTCAAGSLIPEVGAGWLMMVTDHLNLLGGNPLIGRHDPTWGPRFPDLAEAWDAGLADRMRRTATRLNIALAEGIYAAVAGPSFETPAEVRMLRRLGADAVGMSMVPECIVARQCGMKVVGCSVITNHAVGVGTITNHAVKHETTLRTAGAAAEALTRLVSGFLEDGQQ